MLNWFAKKLGVRFPTAEEKEKWRKIEKYTYYEYMKSDEWEERKTRYYSTHDKSCVACGSFNLVDLHHMTYANLKAEKDEDLTSLCETCHTQYHAIYEYPSEIDTKKFVAAKQAYWGGKEIFLRNQDLIKERINKVMTEWSPKLLYVLKILNSPEYTMLPYKERQRFTQEASEPFRIIEAIPDGAVREIAKTENDDYPNLYHTSEYVEGKIYHMEQLGEIISSLEYRWVAEEIKAIIFTNRPSSEFEKLKGVLKENSV
ncbi:MAG: hypothetical protein A2427_02355 [Candidatus Nealsonbacteria bacterium RIFOXYC1_FULL_40_7]|uniref:HNH endonuclease n=1 Tax=Candidatus Nealsonbacteria bacterium RIFOXYC1_FULL_40_7 TaxID=1801678 RepID=A0A1G2ES13_9BACT|nr:MAG: hypothetical protein A2427_02355 [Candidatus Nealsonbacteria bacterium RIFOXYC1_FULL_40_7]